MTATISFEVGVREQALRISNKALRFLPQDRNLVRESDRDLLDGKRRDRSDDDEKASQLTAVERAAAKRRRRQRHVWIVDGEHLKAVEITLGIDDNKHTEIMAGELAVGDEVVTGVEPKKKPS